MSKESEDTGLWQVDLTIPDTHREKFEIELDGYAEALFFSLREDGKGSGRNVYIQKWDLTVYGYGLKNQEILTSTLSRLAVQNNISFPSIKVSSVVSRDWLNFNRCDFPLIFAERFVVHSTNLRPPRGRTALCIDAGSAFGSGSHESTRGCLLALDALVGQLYVQRALDLGSGSGILAVAIAKSWCHARKGNVEVLAVDNDPNAIASTISAIKENTVSDRVQTCLSEGFAAEEVVSRGPYDLICANILAQPIKEMASDLVQHLAPNGVTILSGLLVKQEDEIEKVYKNLGLEKLEYFKLNEWSTLVFTR